MSQISRALNKVQEIRESSIVQKGQDMFFVTEVPPANDRWVTGLLAAGCAVAVVMGLTALLIAMTNSGVKKIQETKIKELTALVNKNKGLAELQMRALNSRLNKETEDRKELYGHLKEAIFDDKQEIDFLDRYIHNLNKQ